MAFDERFLGRTGLRVSPLALGTMTFGGRRSVAESEVKKNGQRQRSVLATKVHGNPASRAPSSVRVPWSS